MRNVLAAIAFKEGRRSRRVTMSDREKRISERAHQIWEEEGRPTGRDREHWERATREIDDENAASAGTDEVPRAAKGRVGSTPRAPRKKRPSK
jgi:hypothetical protein